MSVGGFTSLSEALREQAAEQLTWLGTPDTGPIKTGLSELDDMFDGLGHSGLQVVSGVRGAGVTSFLLNIARNAAIDQKATVAILSVENGLGDIARRLLCIQSGIEPLRLPLDAHSNDDERILLESQVILQQASIWIDDPFTRSVESLQEGLLELVELGGMDLVILDGFHLIESRKDADIEHIIRSVLRLCGNLKCGFLVGVEVFLSDLMAHSHLPVMGHLDSLGLLNQYASVATFIHREAMYVSECEWTATHPDRVRDPYPSKKAQLIVEKNRFGPTGSVTVEFNTQNFRFSSLS